jgi:hypothetical protein
MMGMYQGRRQISTKGQWRAEVARERRSAPHVAAYQAVHTLHAQGTPTAAIASALGISRMMVYAYLRRHAPPGPKRPQWRRSAQVLMPYLPYLIRRWRERGANSMQLWREIQALGYTHAARTGCRFITRLRRAGEAGGAPEMESSIIHPPAGTLGPRRIVRDGLPGRQAIAGDPDGPRPAPSDGYRPGTGVGAEPGLSDHGPGAPGRSPGGVDGGGDTQ